MNPYENGQRRIEFSDIAPIYAEIQQHPYAFLGLPDGANIADVRARYIAQARLYHTDMVNPSFDQKALVTRYTPKDFATLENIPHTPGENPEELFEHLKGALLTIQHVSEKELKRRLYALNIIQAAAHEKMIQLNTAFETIKMQIGERQWKMLAGYDSRIVHDEDGFDFQQIFLEGAGELTIFPKADQYWEPGAILAYDWGPLASHELITDEPFYRHDIMVKHLFIQQELQEGRKQITPVLLQPFFETFRLQPEQQDVFMHLLVKGTYSGYIREALGIPGCETVEEFSDDWHRGISFETEVNEMQTLSDSQGRPTMRFDDGQLILKDYTETIFSQTDVMLLSTLAYGPMLSNG